MRFINECGTYLKMFGTVRGFAQVYGAMCSYSELCVAIRSEFRAMRSYSELCVVIRSYAERCAYVLVCAKMTLKIYKCEIYVYSCVNIEFGKFNVKKRKPGLLESLSIILEAIIRVRREI